MNNDNLELATIKSRTIAFIIDDFIVTFIVIFIYFDSILASSSNMELMLETMNQFLIQILLLKFIYQTFFVWYYGATIGKIITKVRVIDYYNFGKVTIFTAMARSVLRIISEMFFYMGFIFAFFNEARQTFHDKLGRTLVINA